MMRLRKIWAEGSFSVFKREHCLPKVRKRGIPAVTEECLLSCHGFKPKKDAKAILLASHKLKIWTENIHFHSRFLFCQQVQLLTLPPLRMLPLLADFIQSRICKPRCEKFLTHHFTLIKCICVKNPVREVAHNTNAASDIPL